MAGIRENILVNSDVRDQFLTGMALLDQPNSGIMASDLAGFLTRNNIPLPMRGAEQELSVYDIFVFWHIVAMSIGYSVGNAAHSGPIFLPWHRMYLIRLEEALQNLLDEPDFGLPYWDWAADGEQPVWQQWRAEIWGPNYLGEARGTVRTGPTANMRVRLAQDTITGELVSIPPRQLQRAAGMHPQFPDLPDKDDEQFAHDLPEYDMAPWDSRPSLVTHRNVLEGWVSGPQMHNRVHVWIGGDMGPGTSPNDPVFFLNHCNVDRLWEHWMGANGRVYAPRPNRGPLGHRLDDAMVSIIGNALAPQDVLDPAAWYVYDNALIA